MIEKLKDRYVLIAISLMLVFVMIIVQLVNIQIIQGKDYDEQSQRKLLNERSITAPRGNILDRNGVPIAVNQMGFSVQVVKAKMTNDALNAMVLNLVSIFEKNGDTYSKTMSKFLTINPITFGPSATQSEAALKRLENEVALKPKDVALMTSPEAVFKYLRKERYKISDKYTDEEAYKIMSMRYEIRGYTTLSPVCVAKDVTKETVAEIEERHQEFPGVTTEVQPARKYVDGLLTAHVVGYVQGINGDEYKRLKDEGYDMNDIIGKCGVELAAEKYLRGKDGLKKIEMDTGGRLTEELHSNPAIPGDDVVLTLDTRLQKVAMESLQKNIEKIRTKGGKGNHGDAFAGAAVAIDVNRGEVLAMASYPSYEPSLFLAGSDNKDAQKALSWLFDKKNTDKPSLNRAMSEIYAPGSTFKPITAIAGLETGVITPESNTINDPGIFNIGGWDFKCLEFKNGLPPHGDLTLERALATSCNIYFHRLGASVGIDNIDKWARYFGLGQKTGVDIDSLSESPGILASREYKKKVQKDDWRIADTAQAAIGQFDNKFTPLQLANYISTLANGGKRFKPYVIKRVIKYDGSTVTETKPEFEQIPVKPETLGAIRKGMEAVAYSVEGTAAGLFDDLVLDGQKITVAGKTGTAETGNDENHSSNALFVCYAPAEAPRIAVAVVVERGAWGANTAPIAHDILAEYFGLNNKSALDDRVKPDEVMFTR